MIVRLPQMKNNLCCTVNTIYISRSLSAFFTRVPPVHSLMLSRSKQDIGGHTLSQLTAGHKPGRTTSTGAGV